MTAPPLQGMANLLESQGRYGDTELVHMSQPEVRGLASLGRLTRNPETGLMEAFSIGGFFKDYVAPAALFAVPGVGPFLSAGYTGIKSGIESGSVLTGITSGLLSYGAGKIGDKLFKGVFGGAEKLSPGAESFKASMEKGTTKGLQQSTTAGANFGQLPMGTGPSANVPIGSFQNVPIGERTGALFSNAAASVPESGLKQFVKTAAMPGGMKQLGSEFAKNLMTPQTAVRGLTSGVVSELTRTPEYAEATGFATDDSDRNPYLMRT